jgi:hypothetical protein
MTKTYIQCIRERKERHMRRKKKIPMKMSNGEETSKLKNSHRVQRNEETTDGHTWRDLPACFFFFCFNVTYIFLFFSFQFHPRL